MQRTLLAVFMSLAAIAVAAPARAADRTLAEWRAILDAPVTPLPPLGPNDAAVVWRTDLTAALDEAQRTNKPLFVTFRCLPCKQCSAFDKDVLEGGTTLTPLLQRFVTVRITDASQIDFRYFPVEGFADLDMSWWGWFLSPEGRVYGVFGGKDEVSDATRISVDALANTMRRVLDHHRNPARAAWSIDGPLPDLASTAPHNATELPSYNQWKADRPWAQNQTCIHCHQVQDMLRLRDMSLGTFDKNRDVWVWPLPENVGLTVDRDHGLRVTKVTPGSPAAKAGMQPGDELAAAGDRLLFGQADFRGVLHRGPKAAGDIDVVYRRGDDIKQATLHLADGWRKTVLDWRMTMSQGVIGVGPGFFPLKGPDSDTMSVKPFWGKNAPYVADAGLKKSHVITAVDGQSPPVSGRAFLTWFRFHHNPGDKVTLTVKEGGKTHDITYTLKGLGE
ncbi:MAG: PDZ domain-containing protein [Phycisphaera sp.]|nr:PDZ domain-containing protein [Phycisphaera sp.]